MKIGFTGTQQGMTDLQRKLLIRVLHRLTGQYDFFAKQEIELHHGDCIGADLQAHFLFMSYINGPIHIHPPVDERKRAKLPGAAHIYPPRPYLERNHKIVEMSDFLIATPQTVKEVLRSGTWATVRYARICKKPVILIFPDGTERRERWAQSQPASS